MQHTDDLHEEEDRNQIYLIAMNNFSTVNTEITFIIIHTKFGSHYSTYLLAISLYNIPIFRFFLNQQYKQVLS